MSFLRTWSVLGLILVLTNVGNCDLLPPETRPEPPDDPVLAPVKIVQGQLTGIHRGAAAKIVIPRHFLPQLQRTRNATGWNKSPVGGTIIAGLAMSAAAVSLMFLIKKCRRRQAGLVCLTACIIFGGGYALLADIRPPGGSKPRRGPIFQPDSGPQIAIVVQEEGDEVVLILQKMD